MNKKIKKAIRLGTKKTISYLQAFKENDQKGDDYWSTDFSKSKQEYNWG